MADGGGEPVSLPETRSYNSRMPQSFTSIQWNDLTYIKQLGSGGFGLVELHKHKNWGEVAVKKGVKKHITKEHIKSFYKEAERMLSAVTMNQVITVIAVVETPPPNDEICIVMEYMEFGNLKNFTPQYMVRKNGDKWVGDYWSRRIRMIHDMVLGMNFLHTLPKPIIHRDLKLENIFVGAGFVIKIGDLGLSISIPSAAEQEPCRAGTTSHLPPEVLTGEIMKATKAWDIYSFGITLFEFIALTVDNMEEVPWQNFPSDLIISWVADRNRRPDEDDVLPGTPQIVHDTMVECWNSNPAERPPFQKLKNRFYKLYKDEYESFINADDAQILLKRQESLNKAKPSYQAVSPDTSVPVPVASLRKSSEQIDSIKSGDPRPTINQKVESLQQANTTAENNALSSHLPQGEYSSPESLTPYKELRSSNFESSKAISRLSYTHAQPSSTIASNTRLVSVPEGPVYNIRPSVPPNLQDKKSQIPSQEPALSKAFKASKQQHGATRYSDASSQPKQVSSGKDDAGCLVVTGRLENSLLYNQSHMPGPAELQKPFQNLNLQSHTSSQSQQHDQQPSAARPSFGAQQPSLTVSSPGKVGRKHILKIENLIGCKYKKLGHELGFTDTEITTIHRDNYIDGIDEVVHQLLMKWLERNGSKATKKVLASALRRSELEHVINKL